MPSPNIARPIRTTLVLFAALATLFVACAPFQTDLDLIPFVGFGLAYSLLLGLFGVGMTLAGRPAFWWLLSGLILGSSSLPFFLLLLQCEPETAWQILPVAMRGLLAFVSAWLFAGTAVAVLGWVRHFRSAPQCVPPNSH